MKIILLLLCAMALSACGGPIGISGSYEDAKGTRYGGGVTFELPKKGGYAK